MPTFTGMYRSLFEITKSTAAGVRYWQGSQEAASATWQAQQVFPLLPYAGCNQAHLRGQHGRTDLYSYPMQHCQQHNGRRKHAIYEVAPSPRREKTSVKKVIFFQQNNSPTPLPRASDASLLVVATKPQAGASAGRAFLEIWCSSNYFQ